MEYWDEDPDDELEGAVLPRAGCGKAFIKCGGGGKIVNIASILQRSVFRCSPPIAPQRAGFRSRHGIRSPAKVRHTYIYAPATKDCQKVKASGGTPDIAAHLLTLKSEPKITAAVISIV